MDARLKKIKAWRKRQHKAGKPCGLIDYYRAFSIPFPPDATNPTHHRRYKT